MTVLEKFILSDGSFFLAEVENSESLSKTMRGGSGGGGMIVEAIVPFQIALSQVKNAAEAMIDGLRSLANPADELILEFGVKLTAETGAVIAKVATDAHFTVTLKWKSGESAKT
jgi:Trypsin-co-occurring domain 1